MFARCGFAVHAFWIFAGWNGFRRGSLFWEKIWRRMESVTHARLPSELFFFFFFLKRIVSFLFSSSFVLRDPARINVEFVKLAVEYDYCVFVSIGN